MGQRGGFKLQKGRFRLDVMQKFFTQSGEALDQVAQNSCGCPMLELFKARLDGALGNVVYWVASLPMAGGWELDGL